MDVGLTRDRRAIFSSFSATEYSLDSNGTVFLPLEDLVHLARAPNSRFHPFSCAFQAMSDDEREAEKPFAVERAKTGRAKCKKCKCPIEKDTVRIAKLIANPFSDGKMKAWHHTTCLFEVFAKQRATTKRIDDPEEDISGWQNLGAEDRAAILRMIEDFENSCKGCLRSFLPKIFPRFAVTSTRERLAGERSDRAPPMFPQTCFRRTSSCTFRRGEKTAFISVLAVIARQQKRAF